MTSANPTPFSRQAERQVRTSVGVVGDLVDLAGAGDTVETGVTVFDAARLANCAAGVVVMKEEASASPSELLEVVRMIEG